MRCSNPIPDSGCHAAGTSAQVDRDQRRAETARSTPVTTGRGASAPPGVSRLSLAPSRTGEQRMVRRHDLRMTEKAAIYVGLSPRTLERYRVTGQGPTYLKNGRRVLYRQADLDQWLENNRRRSTSDPGPEPEQETKKRSARRRSRTRQPKGPTRSRQTAERGAG